MRTKATILLLLATFFWGMTFILVKESISSTNPLSFLAWRFLAAALFTFCLFKKKCLKFTLKGLNQGIFLGILLAAGYIFQTFGLVYTTPARCAFITGFAVVLVPVFSSFLARQIPSFRDCGAALISFSGICILSSDGASGFSLKAGAGEILTFSCTVFYALHIVFISRFSKSDQGIFLSFVQMLFTGTICLITAAVCSSFQTPEGIVVWGSILFCSIFATVFVLVVQNSYQSYVSDTKAAVIYSLEPVFAALASYFFCNEFLSFSMLAGSFLIFTGMMTASPENSEKNMS